MNLVIENVSKKYTNSQGLSVEALKDVSLCVGEKEFVVLLGPSGCGKSTLLHMVGGLLQPSSGRIYFDNLKENRDPVVATVFQEIGLFPWLNVSDNVSFGLEELPLSKEEKKAITEKNIRLVGLQGFETSYPHQLSGGMKQRAGIARALSVNPDLLLMDEPFSALDAQTRTLLQEELLQIWESSKLSTLYVTHSISEAVYLADRIIVFSHRPGRIKEVISVNLPRLNRDKGENLPIFDSYVNHIWNLIRKDAEIALRAGGE